MDQMMKLANNEALTDQEFCEEAILFYTDVHKKRFAAGQNMIRKFRAGFKRGDAYGFTLLETLFPESDINEKEQIYRQQIAIDRMERRMNEMEKQNQKKEKEDTEEFYDCQAELIQQKEYVAILQAEEVIRKRKMLQYTLKIKEMIQTTNRELEGVTLAPSPYLKEKKELLLKQSQRYTELLGFLE